MPQPLPNYDAGIPPYDASVPQPTPDGGGATTQGQPGSCTNPLCGSTGSDCGCQGGASGSPTVYLGCQAGGECACFQNGQQQSSNVFDENGACADNSALAALFLANCTCP